VRASVVRRQHLDIELRSRRRCPYSRRTSGNARGLFVVAGQGLLPRPSRISFGLLSGRPSNCPSRIAIALLQELLILGLDLVLRDDAMDIGALGAVVRPLEVPRRPRHHASNSRVFFWTRGESVVQMRMESSSAPRFEESRLPSQVTRRVPIKTNGRHKSDSARCHKRHVLGSSGLSTRVAESCAVMTLRGPYVIRGAAL